jgi:hypothetical protein
MTLAAEQGAQLLMPLLPLVSEPPPVRSVARLLDLDDPVGALVAWTARVREASEACLLVDDQRRVAAMSPACGALLALQPSATVGALLLDLVAVVDFSAGAVPLADPHQQVPPLRALGSGSLARALVRLRQGDLLRTYDVVGVPLTGGAGALAFFTEL